MGCMACLKLDFGGYERVVLTHDKRPGRLRHRQRQLGMERMDRI